MKMGFEVGALGARASRAHFVLFSQFHFDLVDSLYRQQHGLTVTGNYSMRDLVEHERMHPAIVRRLDDMCRVVEV